MAKVAAPDKLICRMGASFKGSLGVTLIRIVVPFLKATPGSGASDVLVSVTAPVGRV
jgi:hypothetical protein